MKESESDRSTRNNRSTSNKSGVTRRRFMQSTAALSTLSVSANEIIAPASAQAQETTADIKLAQAASPPTAARAPVIAARPETPLSAEPPISVLEFVRLSQVLTGHDDLDTDLAAQYLQRCSDNEQVKGLLKELVQALSSVQGSHGDMVERLADRLLEKLQADNDRLFKAAEQIIYLWYVGGFFQPNPTGAPGFWDYGPPEHYFRGLAWPTIGVKPPMSAHNSVYWTTPGSQRG
jgi:hypothetical protein